jgi:hypothetical protein
MTAMYVLVILLGQSAITHIDMPSANSCQREATRISNMDGVKAFCVNKYENQIPLK